MRRKACLPTDDVVETPRELHGCSCPSLEAGANQSKHVLGENRVQNQAGVRTAELTEAQARAQAGQTTDRETLAQATDQGAALPCTVGHVLQKHTWKRLLPNGCSLRHPSGPAHAPPGCGRAWQNIFGTGGKLSS